MPTKNNITNRPNPLKAISKTNVVKLNPFGIDEITIKISIAIKSWIIRNPIEIQANADSSTKSLKIGKIVVLVFMILLGVAGVPHIIVFFTITYPEPLFGILGGVELTVTILLVLLYRLIKTKMENR